MGWIVFGSLVGIATVISLVAYFIFAPRNMWFTLMEEGTAKAVMRGSALAEEKTPEGEVFKVTKGGRVQRILIQWEGYTLSKRTGTTPDGNAITEWDVVANGTVVNGKPQREPRRPFGGFRFFGWWPLDRIYACTFQWTGITEDGRIQRHPREKLDYILLKDDVYWAEVKEAEDIELLPLDVEMLYTIRVVNPYKALFRIQNWLEAVVNRSRTAVRDSMTLHPYRELIQMVEAIGDGIYQRLDERGLLREEFLGRYGVDLRKTEVNVINPLQAYRDETLKKWLGQREAEARAAATVGALTEMLVEQTGMSRESIQEELRERPVDFYMRYEGLVDQNLDLIHRRMGIDGGAYLDIRTTAGEPGKTLLDLVAAWQRMPSGKPPQEEVGEKKKSSRKTKRIQAFGIEAEVPEEEEEGS